MDMAIAGATRDVEIDWRLNRADSAGARTPGPQHGDRGAHRSRSIKESSARQHRELSKQEMATSEMGFNRQIALPRLLLPR
jgi:hypothetical protein